MKDVFAATMHQGEITIADVVNIGDDPAEKREYRVLVSWVGLDKSE